MKPIIMPSTSRARRRSKAACIWCRRCSSDGTGRLNAKAAAGGTRVATALPPLRTSADDHRAAEL